MKKIVKKHAVMMEYVIIAVMIAAAVVVAVVMFGKNVTKEMNVATQSMSTPKKAAEEQEKVRSEVKSEVEAAAKHQSTMHGGADKTDKKSSK